MRRRCCTRSPGGTSGTRPPRRCPFPTNSFSCRLATTRPRAGSAASGSGCPASTSSPAWSPDVEARIRESVGSLEDAGASVEEVSLPHTDYGLATYYIVAPAEASANLARYDGVRYGHSRRLPGADFLADYLATRGEGFGAEVKRRIMLGTYALSAGYYDAFYLKAQKVRTLIKRDFDALCATGIRRARGADLADGRVPVRRAHVGPGLDVPVRCLHAARQHGRSARRVSIPCGLSEGLPVGLQLIGAPWSEADAVPGRASLRGAHRRGNVARPDAAGPRPRR